MANLQDRSTPDEARWKVRWQDGRGRPERRYTFTSPPGRRGPSEAEQAARRLKSYLDLMGHRFTVVEALLAAGFRIEGASPDVDLDDAAEDTAVTVASYAERWLATLSRPNPRTRDDYRKTLALHILPVLGDLDIATLNREQIALWLRAKEQSLSGRPASGGRRRPPALATLANWHGVLSSMRAAASALADPVPERGS